MIKRAAALVGVLILGAFNLWILLWFAAPLFPLLRWIALHVVAPLAVAVVFTVLLCCFMRWVVDSGGRRDW